VEVVLHKVLRGNVLQQFLKSLSGAVFLRQKSLICACCKLFKRFFIKNLR